MIKILLLYIKGKNLYKNLLKKDSNDLKINLQLTYFHTILQISKAILWCLIQNNTISAKTLLRSLYLASIEIELLEKEESYIHMISVSQLDNLIKQYREFIENPNNRFLSEDTPHDANPEEVIEMYTQLKSEHESEVENPERFKYTEQKLRFLGKQDEYLIFRILSDATHIGINSIIHIKDNEIKAPQFKRKRTKESWEAIISGTQTILEGNIELIKQIGN